MYIYIYVRPCSFYLMSNTFFLVDLISCNDPGTPLNGERKIESTFEGDIVEYYCNEGYELIGDEERICLGDGLWSGQLPICRQISKIAYVTFIQIYT